MSIKVNPNLQATVINSILQSHEREFTKSSDRMSSGFKIISTGDNPAGYALSNKMHTKLGNLNRVNENVVSGINAIQTAEGALSEVQNMLQRVNELSIQAANGTNTTDDRNAIQAEIDQLLEEFKRVSKDTTYNTQGLLNGNQDLKGYADNKYVSVETYNEEFPLNKEYKLVFGADGSLDIDQTRNSSGFKTGKFELTDDRITFKKDNGGELVLGYEKDKVGGETVTLDLYAVGGMKIQFGESEGQNLQIAIPELSLKNMRLDKIDVRTEEGAKAALADIKFALGYVSDIRSGIGAYQNRLETTMGYLEEHEENLTASYSSLKDVDMAEEMTEYTRLQVLTQAGVSMLTQANETPESALQLLR